jgi:hypothetical protein
LAQSQRLKKVLQANGFHKHTGIVILISDKVDFRLKSVRRDNEDHFILMKEQLSKRKYESLTYMHKNTGAPIYNKKQWP